MFLTLPCSGVEVDVDVDVGQQEGVSGTGRAGGGRAGGVEGKGFEWVEEGFGMAFGLLGHGDAVGAAAGVGGFGLQCSDATGGYQLDSVDPNAGFQSNLNFDLNLNLGINAFHHQAPQPLPLFGPNGSDTSLGLEFGLGLDGMDLLGSSNPLDDLSFFGDEADGYGLIGGAIGGAGDRVADDPLGIMVGR